MDDLIFVVLFIVFTLINIYFFFSITFRYFKFSSSFTVNIVDFLSKEKMTLIEIIEPSFKDWKENPFLKQKDSGFLASLFNLTALKHKIIIAVNIDEVEVFWMQARLKLFKKSVIIFKKIISKEYEVEILKSISENIIEISDHCPACNEKITSFDSECFHCGLKFL